MARCNKIQVVEAYKSFNVHCAVLTPSVTHCHSTVTCIDVYMHLQAGEVSDEVPVPLFERYNIVARLHAVAIEGIFAWWKSHGRPNGPWNYDPSSTVPGIPS